MGSCWGHSSTKSCIRKVMKLSGMLFKTLTTTLCYAIDALEQVCHTATGTAVSIEMACWILYLAHFLLKDHTDLAKAPSFHMSMFIKQIPPYSLAKSQKLSAKLYMMIFFAAMTCFLQIVVTWESPLWKNTNRCSELVNFPQNCIDKRHFSYRRQMSWGCLIFSYKTQLPTLLNCCSYRDS